MTKAQTLKILKENVETINILPFYIVKWSEFYQNQKKIASDISIFFSDCSNLIIRSSASFEDSYDCSHAGEFKTLIDVDNSIDEIIDAVTDVYRSYRSSADEEILVQPMLKDVVRSGVVFTEDINTGAQYYIVNYYDGSNTKAVTGGTNGDLRTYICFKNSSAGISDPVTRDLIEMCGSIERYFGESAMDIEFGITSEKIVYIFQARPIVKHEPKEKDVLDISDELNRIYKKVDKLSKPHPFLLGKSTIYGVMPDWNPAEILGVRPRKLAISLYKELITDSIWAFQRKNYGYRDLTMHPLMVSFCGIPYIDTRVTFNSFIPAGLNEKIADKLVNYYINKLSSYPKYHDKIEFDIVYSCYYFGISEKLKELSAYGFNSNEITRIEFALLELTNNIIDPEAGIYLKDIEKIRILEKNYDRIIDSDISLIDRIYWLIEECKEYGTLPFAGVARAAFIAVQFLRSFVCTGIMTDNEYDMYMNSLETVNKKMNADLQRFYDGKITKCDFLRKYGHIRPGTYDILSMRYDEAFDDYFGRTAINTEYNSVKSFSFSSKQKKQIQDLLDENGLRITVEELLVFFRKSIEGREHLKFVFTKAVSKILQLVEELGNRVDIDKEDMAHIDISVIKQLYVDLHTGMIRKVFVDNIENNKAQYNCALKIKLPSIIVAPENVYSFYMLDEEPNYITHKTVTADSVALENPDDELEGKIVFIQSADPGYDYIFTKKIAGLITQFGGINSHMAIRCAELGTPAVIGVGETKFKEWSSWNKIHIDCLNRQVIRV